MARSWELLMIPLVAGLLVYFAAGAASSPTTSGDARAESRQMNELHIAGAYACGMLDALQEKYKRPQACDDYKAIARSKGVTVPP